MHEENVELSWESDSQPRSLFMYIIPYSRSLGGKRGGGGKEVSLLKYNRELRNWAVRAVSSPSAPSAFPFTCLTLWIQELHPSTLCLSPTSHLASHNSITKTFALLCTVRTTTTDHCYCCTCWVDSTLNCSAEDCCCTAYFKIKIQIKVWVVNFAFHSLLWLVTVAGWWMPKANPACLAGVRVLSV